MFRNPENDGNLREKNKNKNVEKMDKKMAQY